MNQPGQATPIIWDLKYWSTYLWLLAMASSQWLYIHIGVTNKKRNLLLNKKQWTSLSSHIKVQWQYIVKSSHGFDLLWETMYRRHLVFLTICLYDSCDVLYITFFLFLSLYSAVLFLFQFIWYLLLFLFLIQKEIVDAFKLYFRHVKYITIEQTAIIQRGRSVASMTLFESQTLAPIFYFSRQFVPLVGFS